MGKPIILFLADKRNWAFDFTARSIACQLSDRFRFIIRYVHEHPDLSRERFDLLYVFFWGETWHEQFKVEPSRLVKVVASFRWRFEERYGCLSPNAFVDRYLQDCRVVITPARKLFDILHPLREDVFLCPEGIETSIFRPGLNREGKLRIGWVGNPNDECKGLKDILIPACEGRYDFLYSMGDWPRTRVAQFYSEIDVLAIASIAESQPLPLVESMACGCFPVVTDVGIVRQLVRSGYNGLIVERSVVSFQDAFAWCERHLDSIRRIGLFNSALAVESLSWDSCVGRFGEIFEYALEKQVGGVAYRPSAIVPEPARLAEFMVSSRHEFNVLCSAEGSIVRKVGWWRRLMLKIGGYRWKIADWRINLHQRGSKIRKDGFVRFLASRFIPLSWQDRIKRLLGIQA